MVCNLMKQNRGMTLTSVIIAALLAGIVGQAIIQLFGNQAMAMKVVALREQREDIMEHYKHILISGWDNTRQSGVSGAIAVKEGRSGTADAIPAAGLHLGHDIYTAEPTDDDGWWKVTAVAEQKGRVEVTQSDRYEESEQLVEVTLTVEFEAKDHPYFKGLDLVKRVEKIFFHHNISGTSTKATECGASNPEHESKLYDKLSTTDKHKLYATGGAIIQYDFASNHAKCSQVPLVSSLCSDPIGATFGFRVEPNFDVAAPPEGRLQTGESLCTTRDLHGEQKIGDFTKPAGTDERKRITVGLENCNETPDMPHETGGKYISEIDENGVPKCSEDDYIAPEPAKCMEADGDYPYNSRDPEDWRGGVQVVNDDGSTACIDIQKFKDERGDKGRDGRIENDGTYIHIDLGVTNASDCSIACTSIPGGNYVNDCPDYGLVPDLDERQACPSP